MNMVPLRYRVLRTREEAPDTASLVLTPVDEAIHVPLPGQFTMVYAFGTGEIALSISGRSGASGLVHTVRAVGAVSRAVYAARRGEVLGVRGPYGTDWGLPRPEGSDLLVMAGGIGLAPLRPVVQHAVAHRSRYGRVVVLVGARTPADLLYAGEYDAWRRAGIEVRVTVDRADQGWTGHVGVVTTVLDGWQPRPDAVTAFVCGPEVMLRNGAHALVECGMAPGAIRLSLERNMRCGLGLCGHCQLGPVLVCRDGPVVAYDRIAPALAVREL